ncbi:unnamed protein product, partial [Closterium sp. NIES-54]
FHTWLDDLQLYLLSDSRDSVPLFDHTSGASLAPPATADSATRSQWVTRDGAARLAVRNYLPLAERAHFGQHKTAKALHDTVVARYTSPATAALGRLILPYLFPELSAFATVEDLITHLCTSDTRYRAALIAEFLDKNPPPMYITLYFIVTRLPDSFRAVRDHILALDPTDLTVDLLEKHLLIAETSVVAVGVARGTPRTPFFEGCSPSPLAPSYASVAAVDILGTEDVGAASALSGKRRNGKGKGGKSGGDDRGGGGGGGSRGGGGGGGGGGSGSGSGASVAAVVAAVGVVVVVVAAVGVVAVGVELLRGEVLAVARGSSSSSVGARPLRPSSFVSGLLSVGRLGTCGKFPTQHRCFSCLDDAWRAEFGDEAERPRWLELLRYGVAIFDLDYDAVLAAMYALSVSAEGDCYLCVPPDLGIEAAALGASESALPGTAPAVALHTFTIDSGASPYFFHISTTLTPLPAPVPVRLADPSGGPVLACSSTVLPCLAQPPARVASYRTRLSCGTTALVTPPCHAFVACTPASLFWVFPGLCLPSCHRLPRLAFLASRGGSALLLTPPHFPPRLLPYRLSTWTCGVQPASVDRTASATSPWIRAVRPKLCERFREELPVLRLHCDKGGEFSSDLLRDFCHGEGILQLFTLPASPHQNGVAERRIGLVMEVACTSMIHAAAPHFLWPFADVTFDEFLLPKVCLRGAASGGADPASAEPGGAESEGAESGGAKPKGAEPGGEEPGGAEPEGAEPGGAESEGAESGVAEPKGTAPVGGPAGASPRLSQQREPLSSQQLREWFAQRTRLRSGAAGASGPAAGGNGAGGAGANSLGGAGVTVGARGTGGAGAAGAGAGDPGAGGTGAGDPGAGGSGAGGAGAGGTGAGGVGASIPGAAGASGVGGTGAGHPGARGAGARDPGAGGAGGGGAGAGSTGAGGTVQRQPFFVLPPSSSLTPPNSVLRQSRPALPVLAVRTGRHVPRPRPPPVPGTHIMALRPSSVPLRDPLLPPPASSLHAVPDPESNLARAASPTVPRLLATILTDPSFESTSASALVAELVDFAAVCRLDYATSLVAESESDCPPPVGGECALDTDVLHDTQEDFECLAAAVPHLVAMVLALEGDPDAPDIPTPRSYAEAITCPYSSEWQIAMDAEMASWKSTGTYVDAVPPPRANIVDGMWIFRVKRPPGSPLVFKARYVARGFSQRQRVDFFHTFSPTPKRTTLRVLLHVATQRDYELHSLVFSIAFLQGSLHEEIWLRRPPGFTGSFPAGTQTTLAALGVAPSTADPSLFLRTDTSLPPFYILVYVDELVFATADTEALALVKSELQKRYNCTDLGELRNYLGLQIIQDRARHTITLTQSHMVHQVLQRFGFRYSLPQSTPLPTDHSLSSPPSDESVEPSGPYPELVGCLMYLMTCTQPDLAYLLTIMARYVAPGRHQPEPWEAVKRVLRHLCSTSGMGLVFGGWGPVVLTGYADASWVDDLATQWSLQGYTSSLGSGSVSWRSTRSSSVLSSSCEAEIYAGAMAAQELRWLTFLLTDLGE